MEDLDWLGHPFRRNGKLTQGTERTLQKGVKMLVGKHTLIRERECATEVQM